MKVRFFDFEKDYTTVAKWYRGWKYEPLDAEIMSQYALIVSNEEHDVCAAWIYRMEGGVALFEAAVIDPKAPRQRRKGTLSFLFQQLEILASQLGCKKIMIVSKDRHITKVFKDLGYECKQEDFKVLTRSI